MWKPCFAMEASWAGVVESVVHVALLKSGAVVFASLGVSVHGGSGCQRNVSGPIPVAVALYVA